ncbi:MAG TPA: tRNA guanosine(34) transglycosylase Tgt [Candidatus Limnocylindria bacterium]|nr:tRNA guanosine(34) transglycosylase Tgt [Candidatus Limnocylindria bacterium]
MITASQRTGTAAAGGPLSFTLSRPAPADGSTRARLGHLSTPHGEVATPVFMPVGTNATVKALDPDDLHEVGAQIILANTYHLYLRPGHQRIERLGGLHRFMAWDRPILTDSGGFQVVSLGELRAVDDEGVTFRSHLDGSLHHFTPEHAIAVQQALGSDIAVCLDQPVPPHASTRAAVAEATQRTHEWAERCLAAHRRPEQALFGIVQGGLEEDLRAESTRVIASLPFDGICIGGLAGDETPAQRRAALDVCVPLLAEDPRPRYLMGLGSPADLLDAVDAGIDMFDSVLPARVARNGTLWLPDGRINLRNSRFLDDPAPVQEGCRCRACRSFSRAYLAHLLRADELLFYRLATCHNLTFLIDFMARIRSAIAEGTFPELVREHSARRASPIPSEGPAE